VRPTSGARGPFKPIFEQVASYSNGGYCSTDVRRLAVPGGWLYVTVSTTRTRDDDGSDAYVDLLSQSSTFVSKPLGPLDGI
jgi:hypothetical protein